MAPGAAASLKDACAAASSLAATSDGSDAEVISGVGFLAMTLSTSVTHALPERARAASDVVVGLDDDFEPEPQPPAATSVSSSRERSTGLLE
jgi:hypothetical protein